MHLGIGEMLVVLVIAMLVFGPTKIPQLGEALGKGIRNFKKASSEDDLAEATEKNPEPQQLSAGSGLAPRTPVPEYEEV